MNIHSPVKSGYEANLKKRYKSIRTRLYRMPPPPPPPPPIRWTIRALLGFPTKSTSVRSSRSERLAKGGLAKPFTTGHKASLIVRSVAIKHKTTINGLKSKRRNKDVVAARHEVMWRLHKKTALSMPQIGRILNKDHTTVLHGIRKHQARMEAKK